MPHEYHRSERLAVSIQRELARAVLEHADIPEAGKITVVRVNLSRDLTLAKVYISRWDVADAAAADGTLRCLNQAAGSLRHSLARRIVGRSVPRLVFIYDGSGAEAARISALLAGAPLPRGS